MLCIAAIFLWPSISASLKTEEERIIEEINWDNTDFTNNVSELIFTKEVEDGLICVASSQNDLAIVSYLRDEKWSDTQYVQMGRVITEPENIVSDNPLKVTIMRIANFSKESYYFGFCTSEQAKKLIIDGNTVEPEKIELKLSDRTYIGYFWFVKSVDKPTVQISED